MRTRLVITVLATSYHLAGACPSTVPTDVATDEQPATSSPCVGDIAVDFSHAHRVIAATYSVGAGGVTRSGTGSVANVFAALDLSYGLQFGSDPEQPSYEIEVNAGAAVQRSDGDVSATGLVTRAGLRLGPARMAASALDDGRGNFAAFPLTMEIAHTGELAARPRMSARPELARAQYNRERVELATRIIRVEGAGEKAQTEAPGMTEVRKPSSWAVDVFPLYSGVDIAMQDSTRIDFTVGGAMMGVVDHTSGASLDLLRLEHRHIDYAMMGPTDVDTVWMLKLDGIDPHTGAQYYMGWGELIVPKELETLAHELDPTNGSLTIGGLGWFSERRWGGFGMQYKREPYVTMQGKVGLEDRFSTEVYVPRALGLVARTFVARTMRMVDDDIKHDVTAGVEVDASYARSGFTSKLGFELGRTYYTALDNTLPSSTGFGMALDLTVQHSGSHTW